MEVHCTKGSELHQGSELHWEVQCPRHSASLPRLVAFQMAVACHGGWGSSIGLAPFLVLFFFYRKHGRGGLSRRQLNYPKGS